MSHTRQGLEKDSGRTRPGETDTGTHGKTAAEEMEIGRRWGQSWASIPGAQLVTGNQLGRANGNSKTDCPDWLDTEDAIT